MKNRLKYLLLVGSIVSSVMLSGCKKDNDSPSNGDDPTTGESGTFKDNRDGKTYKWVKIGKQVWMAENLNYTGSGIQHITDNDEWVNNSDYDGWCYYDNNENYGNTYGALYQWEAAKTACPSGWHLPIDEEWTQLENYLIENGFSYDGVVGGEGIAKSLATDNGWSISDELGAVGNSDFPDFRNKTGFSALPGGVRNYYYGTFHALGYSGDWWSATENGSSDAYLRSLRYDDAEVYRDNGNKSYGFSVRCVKNNENIPNADFTSNITSGTAPLTVTFTDQSTKKPTSWHWNFGDGGTSTEQNPVHIYDNAGTYTVKLTASNDYGSNIERKNDYIHVENSIPTFTDPRDGQTYKIVTIGSQIWFAENLNYKTNESWWYDNSSANGDIYGRLYTWDAAINACPEGWHLPNNEEWNTLADYLGGENIAGGKMKEKGLNHWETPNLGATNESGFTGLPGGARSTNNGFIFLEKYGYIWSSTSNSDGIAYTYDLQYNSALFGSGGGGNIKTDAISVRCIKNNDNTPDVDFTSDITSGAAPLFVNFTCQTTNNPTSWQWDFGDGGISTERNPEHIYNDVGTYMVKLTVSNDYGSNTETKNEYIHVENNTGSTFTDPRDGQTYRIVTIGNQTWFAENLNIGTRIDGSSDQTNNNTIEKYCYNDKENNCDIYGGLYQWSEMMQYSMQEGAQGICPDGWHIPSDDEWKTLEMYLGMSQSEADNNGWRGTDEGKKLKSTSGWNYHENGTDEVGFSALPGGYHYPMYDMKGANGYWWTATDFSGFPWMRNFSTNDKIRRYRYENTGGFSVRCIRD